MNQNKYSNLKIVQFPEKLASFSSGRIAAPLYVRVKPVNFCNHGCHWCCVAGTVIETPGGSVAIEDIRPGDYILTPDGQAACVKETSVRLSSTLVRLTASTGAKIEVTPEHPFLTGTGWRKAADVQKGDKVFGIGNQGLSLLNITERGMRSAAVDVFNISNPPHEAYLANGFAVHNCVYKSDRREPTAGNSPAPIDNTMHMDMVEKDSIPAGRLFGIIDDFKTMGVKAVTFSGGGEPLLHREIVTAMHMARFNGIDLSIITNGQNLDGDRATALGYAKWVRVSMDYTTAEQMARFRRVPAGFYQKVIDNIGAFAKSKELSCDLGVNFIVHRDNCAGTLLVEFAYLMKSLGVGNVRFSPMWCQDFHAYHESIRVPVEAQLRRCQELVSDTFTVNSTYDVNFAGHGPARGQTRCLFAQTVPVIGADLNVYACHNKAYDKSGLIGSIRDQSFKEMWFSKETAAFFKRLNPNEDCRHQCANHNKVALYNELTEASYDNFV